MFDFAFALTGVPAILFASIRVLIDSGATKCECDMGMRPITKFLFKLIYNENILSAFRKVIQSLSYSEIEIIKDFGIKFRKNHSATWSDTVLSEIPWTMLKTWWWEFFAGFWDLIQLKHLVEINCCGLVIK